MVWIVLAGMSDLYLGSAALDGVVAVQSKSILFLSMHSASILVALASLILLCSVSLSGADLVYGTPF